MPKLQAVIFDWAGTMIDFGSRAPVAAFLEVFRRRDIDLSIATARAPMGMAKRDHLAAMLRSEEGRAAWRMKYDRDPAEETLDELYAEFLPLQCEILPDYADVIPGVVETVRGLRDRALKIGSTTGYSRAMVGILAPLAAKQGLTLDCILCADEVPAGRPKPWMIYAAMQALDVYPPRAVVNVDDTVAGTEAGRNAGAWTVGIAATGSETGLSPQELSALDPEERQARIAAAREKLQSAGADFVVDSVADLPSVIDAIVARP